MAETLTKRQRAFIDEYFICNLKGAEAARRLGSKQPRLYAHRMITNDNVSAEIERRLREKQMSADEALARLGDMARSDMGDFLQFKDGVKLPYLDLKTANEKGLLKLVKKFKYNAEGHPEIELYDAQAAIRDILKIHGKFKDVTTNLNVDLSSLTDAQLQRIAAGDDPISVIATTESGG